MRDQQRETAKQQDRELEVKRQAEAKAEEDRRAIARQKRAALVVRFKELFGKTFVEANIDWHRKVLESEVDQILHATAYALHEAYKREFECQSHLASESAKLGAKAASTQLRQRFWALFEVARDIGLPVRWSFIPRSQDKFVGVLSVSEKDEMVASDEQYGKTESVEVTYRAYVLPLPRGYFMGNVTFCEVKTVDTVAYEFKDVVNAKSKQLVTATR